MRLHLESNDGTVACVAVIGQVTQSAFGEEDEPLARVLGDDAYRSRVLLSLRDSDYIDSRGVGWLLKINRRFRQSGGTVVVHSIPPVVHDVLKVLHVDDILNLADDERAARAKAQGTVNA